MRANDRRAGGGIDGLIDPDRIRVLLAVADAKSITAAAARLGVSQPSISQQVKKLEALAGRTLFKRGNNGVELTNDGEAVVVYARSMIGLTDDLRRHLRQASGTITLSLGLAEDFCRTAFPTVLWLFMRDHPHVEIRTTSGPVDTLAAALEAKTIDLAVLRKTPLLPDATPFWSDAHVWVGRADMARPIADPVPLVLPLGPSPVRDTVMATLRAHRRTWRIPFEGLSLASIEAALQAGLGVCASPRTMRLLDLRELGADSGLPPLPPVEFVMATPNGRPTETAQVFAELLRHTAESGFRRPDEGAEGLSI